MAAVATDTNRRQVNCHGRCKRASSILVHPNSGEYRTIYATATAFFLSMTSTPTRRAHGVEGGVCTGVRRSQRQSRQIKQLYEKKPT
jgi:hypothetical protein